MAAAADPSPPVVLVHGWGGSTAQTWERSGLMALLADAGRRAMGIDLLGHGTSPKPHDPEAYADLEAGLLAALPDEPVDAIGFSLGALTLLGSAVRHPERFHSLVLAGIGRNVFEDDPSQVAVIVEALEAARSGELSPDTPNIARLFVNYARQPGNDIDALTAILRRPPRRRPTAADLAVITCPVLVVVGELDFVLPVDDLVAAFGDARAVVVPRVDHFATTESFGFIDATLDFLDALPA